MNARQLQYAVLLSQIRNFSQVAEKLKITQPALSKQIRILEEEVGVRLFDRNTTPVTLTPAGEHFIREAQELLYKEDQLLRSMERFRSGEAGRITIGISPFRSQYLMPGLLRRFRERYPRVQVAVREVSGSDQLRKDAAEGRFDFAVVNLPVDDSLLEVTPIEQDTLVLAVPNALSETLPQEEDGHLPTISLRQCASLPFVVLSPGQEMRQLFDKLCVSAQIHPDIAVEVVGLSTAWAMANAGVGAALLPLQFIGRSHREEKVRLFTLDDNTYSRQPAIVTRRGQYLSDPVRYAISLLTELS